MSGLLVSRNSALPPKYRSKPIPSAELGGRVMAIVGVALQWAGTLLAALFLVFDYIAKAQARDFPDVMPLPPPSLWSLVIAAALIVAGLASVRSRRAGIAAVALAVVAGWYGLTAASMKPPEMFGTTFGALIVTGAVTSIIGLVIRVLASRPRSSAEA